MMNNQVIKLNKGKNRLSDYNSKSKTIGTYGYLSTPSLNNIETCKVKMKGIFTMLKTSPSGNTLIQIDKIINVITKS